MAQIHPLACVEKGAELADDVVVGPFAYVGAKVRLGARCVVQHHASVEGHTTAGEDNVFFPNCLIGGLPQDLKYRGGDCRVIIGNRNHFRECSTVHMGTEDGGNMTRVGDDNLFMAGVHIAHDCVIGSHCVLANNVLLAGHVLVEDWVVMSGASASHHYVRIGQHAFVAGHAAITRDVPPYMMVGGHPANVRSLNRTGLLRRDFTEERLEPLKTAWRMLFKDTAPMIPRLSELEALYGNSAEIKTLVTFLRESLNGKFGRFQENLRGKNSSPDQDDAESGSGQ